jgi:hypothetical protein
MGDAAVRRLGGWCLIATIALTAQPPNRLSAQQVASNRSNAYLFTTDVHDARAIWVNPAGLGVLREASVYAEAAVGDPGSKGKLRQIDAGFNARGLSFGYQHDILDNGVHGNTYRLGLAGGSGGLAAGVDIARYAGGTPSATGWDIGMTYLARPPLTVGLVVTNIGQPVVRGLEQRLTFVPGFTWRPADALSFSTDARITPDSVVSYAFGAQWKTGEGNWPVAVIVRLDTDGGLRRSAFAFGLSVGGRDQFGAIVTTPGDVSSVDQASLYGLSTRASGPGRR